MEKRKVRFEDIQQALLWLISHPGEHLYDQYGNYVEHVPVGYGNIIEYYWFSGDYEDENGNFEPGYWDYDKNSYEEFIDRFEGTIFESL